jgi:hypothetical protein
MVEELVTFCSGTATRLAVMTTSLKVGDSFVVETAVATGVTTEVAAGGASCAQSLEDEITEEKIKQKTTRLKN